MNVTVSVDLMQRIAALEADNSRLKRAAVISRVSSFVLVPTFIILIGAGANFQRDPDELRAKQFVLLDSNNEKTATLASGPDGAGGLFLLDKKNRPRIAISLTPSGQAVLDIRDAAGKAGIRLGSAADGSPVLIFYAREGDGAIEKNRIDLGMKADGSPFLALRARDDPKKALLEAHTTPDGATSFTIRDDKGHLRIGLQSKPDGIAGLRIDEQRPGKSITMATFPQGSGGPSLTIFRADQTRLAGLEVRKDGVPQMVLWDEDRNVLFSTPLPAPK